MNIKKLTALSIVFSGLLLSSTLQAQDRYVEDNVQYGYATVLSSEPVIKLIHVSEPQQQCWDERVLVRDPRRESKTNTILGAIIGGAIGNAVGHNKTNKRVGTFAGALLGGSIAKDMQRNQRGQRGRVQTVTQCETISRERTEERVIGYRVTYHYQGKTYTTRMRRDPGNSVRVRLSVSPVID